MPPSAREVDVLMREMGLVKTIQCRTIDKTYSLTPAECWEVANAEWQGKRNHEKLLASGSSVLPVWRLVLFWHNVDVRFGGDVHLPELFYLHLAAAAKQFDVIQLYSYQVILNLPNGVVLSLICAQCPFSCILYILCGSVALFWLGFVWLFSQDGCWTYVRQGACCQVLARRLANPARK